MRICWMTGQRRPRHRAPHLRSAGRCLAPAYARAACTGVWVNAACGWPTTKASCRKLPTRVRYYPSSLRERGACRTACRQLGTLIAGPFCARILAEFGAESSRSRRPRAVIRCVGGASCIRARRCGGRCRPATKKSVTANLRLAAGQEVVRRLVQKADIVVENFRPGALRSGGWAGEQPPGLKLPG